MPYIPRPIDTSAIQLPADLQKLVEQLAESVHDTWAAQRLAEGWTYGPRRDDAAKTNPDLVPYGDLTDVERSYDRNTVTATLKAILALGYRIEKA
ncbi:MAG: RyR domain-containing protein [Armatimonadota bacterium]